MDGKICSEKHKRVDERLNHHEKWLGDHEGKIDRLDRSDATNTEAIGSLCKQLGSQTNAIWGLVSTIAVSLFGFFVWYIQSLGR